MNIRRFLCLCSALVFVSVFAIGCNDPIKSATVTIGAQSGPMSAGTAGSVAFAVTTTNVSAGTPGSIAWYTTVAGTTAGSNPLGITATVTVVSNNSAIVTMTASSSTASGTYYFKVIEGSVPSNVATLTLSSGTVTIGTQSGTMTAGTAGSVSFAATTTNVSAGTAGNISWYTTSAGTTAGSTPTGVTAIVTAITDNAATVTMKASTSTIAGSYYFKLTEGSAVSDVATLTVTAFSPPARFAGYGVISVSGVNIPTPVYWTKGTCTSLSYPSGGKGGVAYDIASSGGVVYVVGYTVLSSGNYIPALWSNGTRTDLPVSVAGQKNIALRISIADGTTYIAGCAGSAYPSYWKNGSLVSLGTSKVGNVKDVAVGNGNVYAVGYTMDSASFPVPTIWTNNGSATILSISNESQGNDNTATSVVVSGSHLYITGTYNSSSTSTAVPCYWLDGTESDLPIPANANGYAEGIAINGGNVYIAGYYKDAKGVYYPVYWKNGIRVPLSTGSYAGGWCYGITISSSGSMVVSGSVETSSGQYIPATWIDGTMNTLTTLNSTYNSEAEYCISES
jgi:hypothetical protein